MSIQYRPIIADDEFEQAVDLHGRIWFTDDRDAIPNHMLRALQHAGGLLLGAFDDSIMVGFLVGFPAVRDQKLVHWSHATGVLPEYQGRGIGSKLKWYQREWALTNGYDRIAWTFDPLQSGNAKFNIHHLGCICNIYHVDFYGVINDGLNRGLPTDRFEVTWLLESNGVESRAGGGRITPTQASSHFALQCLADGRPGKIYWPHNQARTSVVVPADINHLRSVSPSVAMEWRMITRELFVELFSQGYSVVGFVPASHVAGIMQSSYLLELAT
jgi:predicted GNAT superfamily acetyltransferase